MRVIYNNVDLDLLDDFSISFNKKFNYSGDDESSLGSFSYSTNIPATTRNLEAISYANGFFNVDGINVEIIVDSGKLYAMMIPESIDIDNKTISVQFIDDISHLLSIAENLKFADVLDESYDFNNEPNSLIWNRRYVDTIGSRRESSDNKFTVAVGLNKDFKGMLPFTICVPELINQIASMYNMKIEATNDENVEVIIPYKSLISNKFKKGDIASLDCTLVTAGFINYSGVHQDYSDCMFTQSSDVWGGSRLFMGKENSNSDYVSPVISETNEELLGKYSSISDNIGNKLGCYRAYYIPTYTYKGIPAFASDFISDPETRQIGWGIHFARYDNNNNYISDTSYLSTGGKLSLYVELGGNMYKIATGYLLNRFIQWTASADTDLLFSEPPTIEAGETFNPILHVIAEEEITFYDSTGACPDITWIADEFNCDASDYKMAHRVVFRSNKGDYTLQLKTDLELLPYDEDIDNIQISGLNYTELDLITNSDGSFSFVKDISLDTTVHVGYTLDTAGVTIKRIIEDYIKRFNKSIYSSGGYTILGSKSSSTDIIRTSMADFNTGISISNKSSDDLVRSFKLKNAAGKSKFDTYNDGENLGDSEKVELNSTGKTDKAIEFESTIIPLELTDGINMIDDSVAEAITTFGNQYIAGVFPSSTLEPSSYGLRYGYLGDDIKVIPLYQRITTDGQIYSTILNTAIAYTDTKYIDINATGTLYYKYYQHGEVKDTEHSTPCTLKNGFLTYAGMADIMTTVDSLVPQRIVYNGVTITPDFRRSRLCAGIKGILDSDTMWARSWDDIRNSRIPTGSKGSYVTIPLTNSTDSNPVLSVQDLDDNIKTIKKLDVEYTDSMGTHSLSFNSKAATSADYFNAADEYFSDLFNYIYSANSIYLSGTVYLNRDQCMSILRNNVIFNIDGEEYIPISIENVPINDNNGGLVDVNLIKKQ
jgi:hypothetical protein